MDVDSLQEIDGVPTWLETPVINVPSTAPPTQTRLQVLPLNDLAWEHFERLSPVAECNDSSSGNGPR